MRQSEALDILKTGANVFLTGAPGAGKTYVLNQYTDFLRARDVDAAITAYTGIAASHLNGRTLHSWAGLSFAQLTPEQERERVYASGRLKKRIQRAKVLIIDEISMLHPEEFDRVDFICKTARVSLEPFGGLQLICCGDFFQIPPVNQQDGKFVIDSAAWKNANMKICYLHEQHRQGDAELLKILADIRDGRVTAETITLLKSRIGAKVEAPFGIARLYTHNENVDRLNFAELSKLKETEIRYDVHEKGAAKIVEKLKKDNKIDTLLLKRGARVMFMRNNPGMGYANGTLGEVIDFTNGDSGEALPVVLTFDKQKIIVEREAWELEEEGKTVASVRQIPLRLAWAITIHKSQGMTLDAAEIDLSRAFDKGMGYVALSRVKRLENISLVGLNETALEVSERIKLLDGEFRAESAQTENYLEELGEDGLREAQEIFMQSTKEGDRDDEEELGDIPALHYEIDEIPAIDFE